MRHILAFFTLMLYTPSQAQQPWLDLGDSLIHSQKSLEALAKKAEELQKAFEKTAPGAPILSAQQGYGRYFRIFNATFPLDSLKQDLKNGLNYEQLAKKYPGIEWLRDSVLVYRFERTDWEGNKEQVFAEAPYRLRFHHDPQIWVHADAVASHFAFEIYTSGDSGHGFLFYDRLSQTALPPEAARLLWYVNHVIGKYPDYMFSSQIREYSFEQRKAASETIQKFMGWRRSIPFEERDSIQRTIQAKYKQSAAFRSEVEAVANATLIAGTQSPYQLNDYILPCFPPQKQFELLTHQPLDWSCGNDYGPRYHILRTAQVAAELGELSVFLQAHFRIINDNFGGLESYPGKRTYFRELEAIGMDVVALTIGASLFIKQWPRGNVESLGKSITETSQPELLEGRLLEFISNPKLDDLNRLRLIWLYRNYASCNKKTQGAKLEKLRTIAPSLPPRMREALLD